MKKRGFTLVELLGVMTLLAVIFAFIYPNIIQMLDKGKESQYAEYESSVFLAAEAYVNSMVEPTLLDDVTDAPVSVTYDMLISNGFLNSRLTDPSTGMTVANLANTHSVKVTVASDKTFIYSIES